MIVRECESGLGTGRFIWKATMGNCSSLILLYIVVWDANFRDFVLVWNANLYQGIDTHGMSVKDSIGQIGYPSNS